MYYKGFNGQALRLARLEANLSFEQLEKKSGVKHRSIRHAESGEHVPSAVALFNLTAALGIDAETLFVRS